MKEDCGRRHFNLKPCFLFSLLVFDDMPQRNMVSWALLISGLFRGAKLNWD
ncbi:unnamed protein product [Linum tenue]|uniref:Uncharacterized protein n=1 Tax=Linum tenue TaxID=586396 RepID=A0AAV0JZG6_9ROSI|nr:unnamed protein product [Linum tenue]CAI0416395.1 unnamed protein product [Linum tenue]